MATSRRLSDGWTLTDGVFPPFLLPGPTDVLSALRDQGLVSKDPQGSQWMHEEWVRLRTFSYALRFELPEDDDEHVELLFERLCGHGRILVNGQICRRFEDGGAHFSIDQHIREGENLLEVKFDPALTGAPTGIMGDVRLRTTNYVSLETARFSGLQDGIESRVALYAHISGKFLFKYTVSLDDEAVETYEFIERLKPRSALLTHKLPVPRPVTWNPSRPDETSYVVRLSIERMGVGCELVWGRVALGASEPKRVARLSPALLAPGEVRERNLRALFELGVQAVAMVSGDGEVGRPLFEDNFLPYGLLTADPDSIEALPAERAILPLPKLQALAGDMTFWPGSKPLWKLLGCEDVDKDELEALFGVNATGDAARCIRLTRMLQAERLYALALEARMAGKTALLEQPIDARPLPISATLIESDGAERPAYDALKDAWSTLCACVRLPGSLSAECSTKLSLPVYLLNDGLPRHVSVSASCQDPRGNTIASAAFTALAEGVQPLGELPLRMPDEPCVLKLRVMITEGQSALLYSHDSLLTAHQDGPPMGALMSYEP